MRKRYLIPILACILLLSCCTVAFAHPGATDANGGHYDHSTGEYHYHHGYPAHQHTDGRCPYNYDDRTGQNSGPPVSKSNPSRAKFFDFSDPSNSLGCVLLFFASATIVPYVIYSIHLKQRSKRNSSKRPSPPHQQLVSKPPVASAAPQPKPVPPPESPAKEPKPAPPPEPSPHPALQREVEVSKPHEVEPEPPSRLNAVDTFLYSLGSRDVTLYGVESSYISHVGYLFSQEQLFVRMKSGRVYTYNRIPPELYWEFVHADSIGEFYNRHIKASRRQP